MADSSPLPSSIVFNSQSLTLTVSDDGFLTPGTLNLLLKGRVASISASQAVSLVIEQAINQPSIVLREVMLNATTSAITYNPDQFAKVTSVPFTLVSSPLFVKLVNQTITINPVGQVPNTYIVVLVSRTETDPPR